MTDILTVRVHHTRRRRDFDTAVENCRWMGGSYDAASKTWTVPADRAADVERFVADHQIEVVES